MAFFGFCDFWRFSIDPYDVYWALQIGAKPCGPEMEWANVLDLNGKIFADQVLLNFIVGLVLVYIKKNKWE